MKPIAPWLVAVLLYPLCIAASEATPADPAAPADCAEPTETPIRSGNADTKPAGQDEALDALRKTAEEQRAREAERHPATSNSQAVPSEKAEKDPARR